MAAGTFCVPRFRVVCIAAVLTVVGGMLLVHRFLAVTRPIGRGVLVVEAWIPKQALKSAADVYLNGSYRYLVVVGSQIDASQHSATYTELAADELKRLGALDDRVVTITVPYQRTARTLSTAVAFKKWLLSVDPAIRCFDVYTVGVHARKSWITFQSVLGSDYQVGVIAGPEPSYNPSYWVVSRRGVSLVIRNLAGYLRSKYEMAVSTAR